jgi:hypothetical protein
MSNHDPDLSELSVARSRILARALDGSWFEQGNHDCRTAELLLVRRPVENPKRC